MSPGYGGSEAELNPAIRSDRIDICMPLRNISKMRLSEKVLAAVSECREFVGCSDAKIEPQAEP
ncbi:hypothetical protein PG985_000389 [Apiospora marii]|uniref:Uncharacterized protein n=1 Tax=Apiospora marii TaxID=335849 RepID=A0ABR1R3Q1_9PEZI